MSPGSIQIVVLRGLRLLSLCSFIWSVGAAHAQNIGQTDLSQGLMTKAASLGLGGAYRAIADSNAALFYNPAGIAQRKGVISMGVDYLYIGGTRSNTFGISAVDSKALQGVVVGLAYDRDMASIGGVGVDVDHVIFAMATEFSQTLYVGGSVKGYFTGIDSPLVDGPDGVDADVGLLVRPFPMLSVGLTLHNLIRGHKLEEFPFQLGFGLGLDLDGRAKMAIDLVRDFQTPNAANLNVFFGGEVRAAEGIFLRGGFGLDRIRDNNFYALGFSLWGPQIRLLFTFSQRLNPTSETYAGNLELML